jgi:nicotinamide mononucleotide transporter
MLIVAGVLWLLTGVALMSFTDSDVPWWDAFPTAVSLIGQYLLARKHLENWAVWIIVNSVAVGLFAWKALWLTALLYLVLIGLSVWGWRYWSSRMETHLA